MREAHETSPQRPTFSTAHAGAEEAFGPLYRRHHRFVLRCVLGFGVDPALGEDATQDVFMTALRRAHTFEGRAPQRAWLAGIARRIAFRYRRARARRERCERALATVQTASASTEWVKEHRRDVLHRFLDQLEPAKREAFVLMELEGFTGSEAARIVGASAFTLYSRLRAAKAKLAECNARNERWHAGLERQLAARRRKRPTHERMRRATVLFAMRWLGPGSVLAKGMVSPLGISAGVALAAAVAAVALGSNAAAPPAAGRPEPPSATEDEPRNNASGRTAAAHHAIAQPIPPATGPSAVSPPSTRANRETTAPAAARRTSTRKSAEARNGSSSSVSSTQDGLTAQLSILESTQYDLGRGRPAAALRGLRAYWATADRSMDDDAAILTAAAHCGLDGPDVALTRLTAMIGATKARRVVDHACPPSEAPN